MKRSLFQSLCAFAVSMGFGVFAIQLSLTQANQKQNVSSNRMPQSSVNQIYEMLDQIAKDLDNPTVFNHETAIAYIKTLTESAYNLETKDIYPDTPAEQARFAETRKDWMTKLFNIQLKLRDKMLQFHAEKPLTEAQIGAFRNGNMYLSYAQDFVLMEWSLSQDLRTKSHMFAADFPANLRNPAIKNHQLLPGDIILVRGGSFVSATIARSGDYLSNFSHVAMVIQDPQGNISVAEALMEENLIVYPLDKYLSLEKLSRAAILRPQNQADAKAAALAAYKLIDDDRRSPVRKVFDMLMNPNSHDKIYCFELIKIAYEKATDGRIKLPTFPMGFKKALAGNSFYRGMGNTLEVGAAPDDAFFEPGFDVVSIERDVSQIKKDWAYDVALSSIFEFINEKYEYKRDLSAAVQAKIAYFLKNDLKLSMKKVPPGISADVIELIVNHKTTATAVQEYLMAQMAKNPRPLAYKELEAKAKSFLEANREKYFVPCNTRAKGGMCKGWFK